MKNLSDPSHPAWSFARTLIVLAVFGGLMFYQATNPDWSEGKLLIQAVVLALVAQAGHEALKARSDNAEKVRLAARRKRQVKRK